MKEIKYLSELKVGNIIDIYFEKDGKQMVYSARVVSNFENMVSLKEISFHELLPYFIINKESNFVFYMIKEGNSIIKK